MNSMVITLAQQTVIMGLLMLTGAILYKIGMINHDGAKQMADLCLMVGTPANILQSFFHSFSMQELQFAGYIFLIGSASMLLSILLTRSIFRNTDPLTKYAVIFNNLGFMGIPLVQEVLGQEYVFYMSMLLVVWNVLAWTYGVVLISGDKSKASLKQILLNPNVLVVFIGLAVYCAQIQLPYVVTKTVSFVAAFNTPIAMIVLGTYLAECDIKAVVKSKPAWISMVGRLVLSPLLTMMILLFLPDRLYDIAVVALIGSATPTAGALGMMCQKYGGDFRYGAGVVSISTLLSLITMPVFKALFERLY